MAATPDRRSFLATSAALGFMNGLPAVSADDQNGLEEAVRVAELQISGLTGLSVPTTMPSTSKPA
jgi:uncharacterized protein (DUF1501 family)